MSGPMLLWPFDHVILCGVCLHDILVGDVFSFSCFNVEDIFIYIFNWEIVSEIRKQFYDFKLGKFVYWISGSLPQRAAHFIQFYIRIPPFLVYIYMNEVSGLGYTNYFIWFIDILKDLRPPYGSYRNRKLLE
jgi:hypothetical protein